MELYPKTLAEHVILRDGSNLNLIRSTYSGNLDECTEIGCHWTDFSKDTNAPYTSGYGEIIVEKSGTTLIQRIYRHTTAGVSEECVRIFVKKKLSTLKTQISNIYDLLEQGIYDIDTFTERSSTLKNQITEIETKINTQEKEYEKEKQIINAHEIIVPKIHGILESYDKMDTITEKNNALCSILEKVTYIKTSRRKKDSTQDTFQITIFPKVPHH